MNPSGKILCLDLGNKWVGIALSNQSQTFCFPQKTISSSELNLFLKKIISEEKIKTIVYGLPINLNGTISLQAEAVTKSIQELKKKFQEFEITWVPVDERFSSRSAQNILIAQNKKIKNNKQEEHSIAAAVILQTFLDSRQK